MKFEEMKNKIILGDCYELIKNIPDKSIVSEYIELLEKQNQQYKSILDNAKKELKEKIEKCDADISKHSNNLLQPIAAAGASSKKFAYQESLELLEDKS